MWKRGISSETWRQNIKRRWYKIFWLQREECKTILCQKIRSPKTTCNILCSRWKKWLILTASTNFDLREECKTSFCVKKYEVPRQPAIPCPAGEKDDWFWLPRQLYDLREECKPSFCVKKYEVPRQPAISYPAGEKRILILTASTTFWLERRMQDFILCQKIWSPKTTCNILCRRWKRWHSDCLDNILTSKQLFTSHPRSNHYEPKYRIHISQRYEFWHVHKNRAQIQSVGRTNV